MADPLTIVGGIAAVIQIAEALTHLTSKLRQGIRTVRYAPQEVQRFHLDLSNFSLSLRMFYNQSQSCLQNLEGSPEKEIRKKHIAGLIRECRGVERGFEELLTRFFVGASHVPIVYDPLDRLRWYFRKSLVAGLKLSFESAKSSVTLFLTLHMCEDLVKKINELQAALQEVPRELKRQLRSMQRQLKEQVKVTKEARKRLSDHVERVPEMSLVPDPVSIVEDTRAMEHYATRTLRRESRRIRQGSSITINPRTSRSRDESPDRRFVSTGGPRGPPPSPPGPSHAAVPLPEMEITPVNEQVPVPRRLSLSVSPILSNLRNTPEERDVPILMPKRTASPKVVHGLEKPSTPPQPSTVSNSRTVGPIIHDDGTGIKEKYGEWWAGASNLLPRSTDSHHSAANFTLPSSRSNNVNRQGGQYSHTQHNRGRTRPHDPAELAAENIERGQLPPSAGSSIYDASSPSDIEESRELGGVRRRPST